MSRPRTPRNDPIFLRNQIDGTYLIRQVFDLLAQIEQGWAAVYERPAQLTPEAPPNPQAPRRIVDWVLLTPQRLNQLSRALDVRLKLLNKMVPDLRSMDLTTTTSDAPTLTTTDRANRVAAILRQSPEGKAFLDAIAAHPFSPPSPPSSERLQ